MPIITISTWHNDGVMKTAMKTAIFSQGVLCSSYKGGLLSSLHSFEVEQKHELDKLRNFSPSLIGAKQWELNTRFSIITGANGSGKSHLLKFLKEAYYVDYVGGKIIRWVNNPRVVYIGSDVHYNGKTGKSSISANHFIHEMKDLNKRHEFIEGIESCVLNSYLVDDYEKFKNKIASTLRSKIKNYEQKEIILQEAIKLAILNSGDDIVDIVSKAQPQVILTTIFKMYLNIKDLCEKIYTKEEAKNFLTNVWGKENPIVEVNKLLIKLLPSFKYELVFVKGYIKFKNRSDSTDYHDYFQIKDLSSGEQMILAVIAWSYSQSSFLAITDEGSNIGRISHHPDILIMDEPDKHLDPKLCKLFMNTIKTVFLENHIQVIMTTHRIDTLALAPEGPECSIFTIKKDQGITQIVLTHPLLAMFRITRNLREVTGFRIKVYTEGFTDAHFYGQIHRLLLEQENSEEALFIPSKRYIPEFHSMARTDNKGGGCQAVVDEVIFNALSFNKVKRVESGIIPYKATLPFGIIDDDNGGYFEIITSRISSLNSPEEDKESYRNRILSINRYSVENFLYDPFILSSIFSSYYDKKVAIDLIHNQDLKTAILYFMKSTEEFEIAATENKIAERKNQVTQAADNYFNAIISVKRREKAQKLIEEAIKTIQKFKADENLEIKETKSVLSNKKDTASKSQNENKIKELTATIGTKIKNLLAPKLEDILQKAFSFEENQLAAKICDEVINSYDETASCELKKAVLKKVGEKYDKMHDGSSNDKKDDRGLFAAIPREKKLFSKVALKEIAIIGYGKPISYKYPETFLSMHGHDIDEKGFFYCFDSTAPQKNLDDLREFQNHIKKALFSANRICMPIDLAMLFFDLDCKVREQVNAIIKPNSWSQKILSKHWQAFRMKEKIYADNHVALAEMLHKIGGIYQTLGRLGAALKYYQQVFDIIKEADANSSKRIKDKIIRIEVSNIIEGIMLNAENQLTQQDTEIGDRSLIDAAVSLVLPVVNIGNKCKSDDLDYSIYPNGLEILPNDINLQAESKISCNHLRLYNSQGKYNPDQLHSLFKGQEYKISEDEDIILFSMLQTIHSNKLLNIPNFITIAIKYIDIEKINCLIELGENPYIAEEIVLAISDLGIEKVLDIFFGNKFKTLKMEPSTAKIQEIVVYMKPQISLVHKELNDLSFTYNSIVLLATSFFGLPNNYQKNIIVLFYEFLSSLGELARQLDLNWQVQKILHLTDLWKFESLKTKYRISSSFEVFRDTDSNFKRSVLLKLHPDKNLGIHDCDEDFSFVLNLRENINKPFDVPKYINDKVQAINSFIYKANINFKILDTTVDAVRLIYIPTTTDNAKKFLIDATYLYSIYSGVNGFSVIINGADVVYKVYQGEYNQALIQTITTASYMFIPAVISFVVIPYVGFVYGAAITIYSGYSAANNTYSFYQEYNSVEWQLKSVIAYKDISVFLANSPLQQVYDFAANNKHYEIKINAISLKIEKSQIKEQLEEKGEFGTKLYNYIYMPMLEEKYTLLNKIINEELTKEQTEVLKAKHVTITIEEQSYEHCMEIAKLKDIKIDHYYCYNEEQQILDHVLIGENGRYIDILERL